MDFIQLNSGQFFEKTRQPDEYKLKSQLVHIFMSSSRAELFTFSNELIYFKTEGTLLGKHVKEQSIGCYRDCCQRKTILGLGRWRRPYL